MHTGLFTPSRVIRTQEVHGHIPRPLCTMMCHDKMSQHLQKVATAPHLTILDIKPHLGGKTRHDSARCLAKLKWRTSNFGRSATFRIAKCQGNLLHPLAQTFWQHVEGWKVKLCIITRTSRSKMPKRKRAKVKMAYTETNGALGSWPA